jgi:hypothetical protein
MPTEQNGEETGMSGAMLRDESAISLYEYFFQSWYNPLQSCKCYKQMKMKTLNSLPIFR